MAMASTAFPNLLPGTTNMPAPQHSTAAALIAASSAPTPAATGNNKQLNLLQPIASITDFAAAAVHASGTNLSHSAAALSHQCAIPAPLQNGGSVGIVQGGVVCNGGSASTVGNGRRGTKRSHEESVQEERNDGANGNDYNELINELFRGSIYSNPHLC